MHTLPTLFETPFHRFWYCKVFSSIRPRRLPVLFRRTFHFFQQPEAMNVLIYTGNGTSPTSVKQAYYTLKNILGHAYDVMKVDAATLRTEPWEETCSLLVIPGGRDQPYCQELDGQGNKKIANYVQEGGRYLGFCAGAYYASKHIEFEKGKPGMEIIGSRELAFFPGLSRGTMYPGFVYNSEKGARAVSIIQHDDKNIKTYYNGGGYFVDAHNYDNVKVLCTFEDPGLCGDSEKEPAAGIQCSVGKGSALLFGVHPEYNIDLVDLSENERKESIIKDLKASLTDCRDLLRKSLSQIGINVSQQNETTDVPSLTPLYLSAVTVQTLDIIKTNLLREADSGGILADSNDSFCIAEEGNEAAELQENLERLTLERVSEEKPPVLTVLYPRLHPERDLSAATPDASRTPMFDLKLFYTSLLERRKLEWGGGSWYRFGNAMLYAEVITSTQTVLDK